LTIAPAPGIVVAVTTEPLTLGEWLRQRREERGLSLIQAEQDTRILRRYLEALETGNYDALPDLVVGRGFLRNYARYLDLDPLEAVDRYSQRVAPPEVATVRVDEASPFATGPFDPVPLHSLPSRLSRRGRLYALIAALLVALAALAWWAYPRVATWLDVEKPFSFLTGSRDTPTEPVPTVHSATRTAATATSAATATIPPSLMPTALEAPSATPTRRPSVTPSPLPIPTEVVYTGIFMEIVFTDTSWIQVTVDGVRQFQGELEKETHRSWYADEKIELRIGNAGAVVLTLNGQKLGALGAPGDVVDIVFERVGDSVAQSTPASAPTGTQTLEPPETPAPSATPVAATASPTATLPVTPTLTLTPGATP